MTDIVDFARIVRDMRLAQTNYFMTRGAIALVASRQREAQVDRLVADILAGGDLFERAAAARACAGEGREAE